MDLMQCVDKRHETGSSFQSGSFDVKNEYRSNQFVTLKIDDLLDKVEQDVHISSCDIAEELGTNHKTVLIHFTKKAGYAKKLDTWVTHKLTERNEMNRVLICDSLVKRHETEPFLKRLFTGDEKWMNYNKNAKKNHGQKQATSTTSETWINSQ
ncbi:Histone-lysine N-methyltransferase SETMAR [Eumeta japonica]|uniref:Histone-lysine N-methyltransferase SETMAR n=1 Tax=Eumeta variegata TaxID=151549 RepID=A0A4C1ZTX8_EUMVA|nr:Histone-lysine N-methyltransferase SETMAR [Eumeta japonica]